MVLNTGKPDPQIKDMSINFRQGIYYFRPRWRKTLLDRW